MELPIDAITAAERHRKNLGDVTTLAASIAAVGLLHPIVITPERHLVAGARRLEACRHLGWERVPCHIVTNLGTARELLLAERDENVCRVDMTPSEKVALGLALEELERPRAAERQGTRSDLGKNFPKVSGSSGRVATLVGEAVGMSAPTYRRAKRVVALAEEGKPEAVEALREMDATGKVTPAFERATSMRVKGPGRPATPPSVRRGQLKEVLVPLQRKSRGWEDSYLDGTTPAEARRLLKIVQEVSAFLFEMERGLEARAVTSRALR